MFPCMLRRASHGRLGAHGFASAWPERPGVSASRCKLGIEAPAPTGTWRDRCFICVRNVDVSFGFWFECRAAAPWLRRLF